jgi:hypothetical protein
VAPAELHLYFHGVDAGDVAEILGHVGHGGT